MLMELDMTNMSDVVRKDMNVNPTPNTNMSDFKLMRICLPETMLPLIHI